MGERNFLVGTRGSQVGECAVDWRKVSYGCGQEGSGDVWPKMRQRCRPMNWPDLDKEKDS